MDDLEVAGDTTPEPVRVPLWRKRRAQVVAAVALVGAAVVVATYLGFSSDSQIHVRGSLNLGLLAAVDPSNQNITSPVAGDTCEAAGGYDDISPGATVTVGGSTGQTLGVGALSAGHETAGGYCQFTFDVQVPAGQSAYTVTVSHRGTQTFTPAQVEAGIVLTLGD